MHRSTHSATVDSLGLNAVMTSRLTGVTVTIQSPQCPLGASEQRQGERGKEREKKEERGKGRKRRKGKEKEGGRKDKFWNQKTGILVWKPLPCLLWSPPPFFGLVQVKCSHVGDYESVVNLYSDNILRYWIYVCVVRVHISLCICAYVHVQTKRQCRVSSSVVLYLIFWERLFMEPESHQFSRAGWPLSPRDHLVCWDCRCWLFNIGARDLNPGPHACASGVCSPDLSP